MMLNLAKLEKKGKIDLEHMSLSADEFEALAKLIEESKDLEELHLWNIRITLVDENRTLRSQNQGKKKIGNQGAKRLADALKVNQSIQVVGLWKNRIGIEGARMLADTIRVKTNLYTIIVRDNQIGYDGIDDQKLIKMNLRTIRW